LPRKDAPRGGPAALEGGLGGEEAFGEILALEQEKDGEGQAFSQGSLLVLLFLGERDALGLQGIERVIYPDLGRDPEGFCVKIVKGVLAI
ncbi:MAG: hypothetical protein N2047_01050, partial [Meiothermus sp.]|nr:hypothetical protein [Meiothermus sp.]